MRLAALALVALVGVGTFVVASPDAGARPRIQGRVLARRLVRDFERRGIEFERDGTSEPLGGLTSDGTCPDGRRARRIEIEVPPADSADMYTVTAFVCGPRYWAQRSGGLRAQVLWVGPYVWHPTSKGPHPR